jgi:acyl-ACP thioesterase
MTRTLAASPRRGGTALHPLVPPPARGRVFRSSRRIRLSDRAADGRLRLDAVARYLQDVASDDVDETGWGAPEHLWVVRHLRIDVVVPPVDDARVELATWSSGTATVAAGRRMSLVGDRGGRVELDSVWIHLGPDARPARIEGFGVYAEAAGDRVVSTKLELPEPPGDARRRTWPLRATDVDRLGHVNNAAYWHAVEELLAEGGPDPRRPLQARLDHRHALDLGDEVELAARFDDGALAVAFMVHSTPRALARVEQAQYSLHSSARSESPSRISSSGGRHSG